MKATKGNVLAWAGVVVLGVLLGPSTAMGNGGLVVIPVPYLAEDPTVPHPAYPGHPVRLKAIVRGATGGLQHSWDLNGDGVLDVTYLANTPDVIEATHVFPRGSERRLYLLHVRVQSGSAVAYGTYPVLVFPECPQRGDAQGAPADALAVMKEVAREEALWLLHRSMIRGGVGAGVTGYLNASSTQGANVTASALYLLALLENGHLPAYPPGTYQPYGVPPPAGWTVEQDRRYAVDPYAEDALRLVNWLLASLQQVAGIPMADEANDLWGAAVPGTDDQVGYSALAAGDAEWNPQSLALEALARTGLAGTVAQVGVATGQTLEFVVQQMVDYAVAKQNDAPQQTGGWAYAPYLGNYGPVYSYMAGGWYAALQAAEDGMGSAGVYVNLLARDRAAYMLLDAQDPSGAPYYLTYPPYTPGMNGLVTTFEPAGHALLGCRWLGWDQYATGDLTQVHAIGGRFMTRDQAAQAYRRYVAFVDQAWTLPQFGTAPYDGVLWTDGNYDSASSAATMIPYAVHAVRAGARGAPGLLRSGDWLRQLQVHLVEHARLDDAYFGSFLAASSHWSTSMLGPLTVAAMGARVLTGGGDALRPVAIPAAEPREVVEGRSGPGEGLVEFRHDGCLHTDPARRIVEYQWMFGLESAAAPDFDAVPWESIGDDAYAPDGFAWRGSNAASAPFFVHQHAGTWWAALRVIDDAGESDVWVVGPIQVRAAANRAPLAQGGSVEIPEDQPAAVLLTGSDPDGDALTYALVAGESLHGSLEGTPPLLTYVPPPNWHGTESLHFVVSDGLLTSEPALVTIVVAPVNDAPHADARAATTDEDTAVVIPLSGWDVEGTPLTFEISAAPSHGTVQVFAGQAAYRPGADFHGEDVFDVRASDGQLLSAPARITVTVLPVNDAPVAADGAATTSEGVAVLIRLVATDVDGDGLSYEVRTGPAHGTVTVSGAEATYRPAPGFQGEDAFTFVAYDGRLRSDAATVALDVRNRAPVAHAGDDRSVEATGGTTSVVLDGTGSSDPDGDLLTYAWTEGGTLVATGQSPTVALALGTHLLTLTVTDPAGASSADTVAVDLVDTRAPRISSLTPTPAVLWPANHKMVEVALAGTATDAVDATPTFRIVSVRSNEAVDGLGDGDASPDWEVVGAPEGMRVRLRAERSGTGDGRVYTITVACVDDAGNEAQQTVTVTVPKSSGK